MTATSRVTVQKVSALLRSAGFTPDRVVGETMIKGLPRTSGGYRIRKIGDAIRLEHVGSFLARPDNDERRSKLRLYVAALSAAGISCEIETMGLAELPVINIPIQLC